MAPNQKAGGRPLTMGGGACARHAPAGVFQFLSGFEVAVSDPLTRSAIGSVHFVSCWQLTPELRVAPTREKKKKNLEDRLEVSERTQDTVDMARCCLMPSGGVRDGVRPPVEPSSSLSCGFRCSLRQNRLHYGHRTGADSY